MLRKFTRVLLLLVLLFALPQTVGAYKWQPFGPVSGREEIIKKFFTGRKLSPIEGIWTDIQNGLDIAIINTHGEMTADYIGIAAGDEKKGLFNPGDEAMWLKVVDPNRNFATGSWTLEMINGYGAKFKRRYKATFELVDNDTIRVTSYNATVILMRTNYVRPGNGEAQAAGIGTGFFITSDLIVTNAHVVEGGREFDVVLSNGATVRATLADKDKANDVAILQLAAPVDIKPLAIGQTRQVRQGGRVFAMGHGLGDILSKDAKITEGLINSLSGADNDPREFQISAQIQPGNSGGPLFNDRGEVVGITASSIVGKGAQNVNFAVKIDYAVMLFNSLPRSDNLTLGGAGRQTLTAQQIAQLYGNAVVRVVNKQ